MVKRRGAGAGTSGGPTRCRRCPRRKRPSSPMPGWVIKGAGHSTELHSARAAAAAQRFLLAAG